MINVGWSGDEDVISSHWIDLNSCLVLVIFLVILYSWVTVLYYPLILCFYNFIYNIRIWMLGKFIWGFFQAIRV